MMLCMCCATILFCAFIADATNCTLFGRRCNHTLTIKDSCALMERLAEDFTLFDSRYLTMLEAIHQTSNIQRQHLEGNDGSEGNHHFYQSDATGASNVQAEDQKLFNTVKRHLETKNDYISKLSSDFHGLEMEMQTRTSHFEKKVEAMTAENEGLQQDLMEMISKNQDLQALLEQMQANHLAQQQREELRLSEVSRSLEQLLVQQHQCVEAAEEQILVRVQLESQVSQLLGEDTLKHKRISELQDQLEVAITKDKEKTAALAQREYTIADYKYELNVQKSELIAAYRQGNVSAHRFRNCIIQLSDIRRQKNELLTGFKLIQNDLASLKHEHSSVKDSLQLRTSDLEICLASKTAGTCNLEQPDLSPRQTCWFTRLLPEDDAWKVQSTLSATALASKPSSDHTCLSTKGHYLMVDMSNTMIGQSSSLLSLPFYRKDGPHCFRFWYNIKFNYSHGQLSVQALLYDAITKARSQAISIWTGGDNSNEWRRAFFEIPSAVTSQGYQLKIVAMSGGSGYVAIDDIHIEDAPCS